MPPVAAIAGGIGSLVGGAAVGAAGLAGAAASTVGSLAVGAGGLGVSAASGLVSGVGGLVSGAGSLLFGGPAAGVVEQTTLAGVPYSSMSGPLAYYGTGQAASGVGILGGVASAAAKTVGYLGEIAPSIGGIYSIIKPPPEKAVAPARAPIPSVSGPEIAKSPLPIFGQQPQVVTVGAAAEPKKDYTLYIVLAVVALFLLRRK